MADGESYGGITVPEGDPGALEASAGRLVATAGMLESVSSSLQGVLGGLSWFGPASAAHTGLTGAQSLMATTASGSLIQKAAVINDYALVLEAAQRQAKKAIERAKDADRRIKAAEADIDQAITDQGTANARIIAAQAAQSRIFSSVVDFAFGDSAATAAVDAAAAEEADARRDLEAAQERERVARRRLEEAREDREDAQKSGDNAEEAVKLARTGLIAAAQGAGLLPTQPGGPADPAFAAAAGIRLEPPKPPPKDEGNWFERRLDDVGDAATWTWDQAKQVPGGAWEGTKGLGEGLYFVSQLNPTNPMNWRDPGEMIDRYKQLGETGKYAYENPGEFGKAIINYEDLAAGRYGEWLGNLAPDAVVAIATGGTGAVVTRSTRLMKATDKLTDATRAYDRATDIQRRMPTQRYRDDRTIAAQPGDDGGISISGDTLDLHEKMLQRAGEDPALLSRQTSDEMRDTMRRMADHETPRHGLDIPPRPDGWYNGTHAELRLLSEQPKIPVGVTKNPCAANCDPAIQRLAAKLEEDIVVQSPRGTTLYRGSDGAVIPDPSPKDFSGVNSRWPGVLWGAGGGGASLAASGAGP
jgi:type II secretory pathway pseudopilin PulG